MRKLKQPTITSQVVDVLRGSDNFLTAADLMRLVSATKHQIEVAVFYLRDRRAIDVVIEPDGVGWWFALPPESDVRTRIVDQRVPEPNGRRRKIKEIK